MAFMINASKAQRPPPPVIRIAVVRDPYERLLSGYLDKIAYQPDGSRLKQSESFDKWCPNQDFAGNFDTFIACLLRMHAHFDGCSVDFCHHMDAHLKPQVCCSMQHGGCSFPKIAYTYLLTVHDIQDWCVYNIRCRHPRP